MTDSAVLHASAARALAKRRRLPIGAEYLGDGRTHVRVWAPAVDRVSVVVNGGSESADVSLSPEAHGYHSGAIEAHPGDRYGFRLADDPFVYPDPASRFQPEGPHRLSAVIDPAAFDWHDAGWRGVSLKGQVIYEMHVGTFTREGTYAAAARELPALADLGITVVEVMPLAEFDGRFGWGYDGVNLYAPSHLYGTPDDFRQMIDAAHRAGVAVILDVVYNHVGPSGNYLRSFSPSYFTSAYDNEWGEAINFDGPGSAGVRELFVTNAGYWIDEFHLDGLRLDATQQIFDNSPEHVLTAVGRRAREAAGARSIIIVAENERQESKLIRPIAEGGYGLDAVWNDDFHHSAMVALTGRREAYYSDTAGTPQEFLSAAKYGYLFQGQHYAWQGRDRGTPAWDRSPEAFVAFLQNHDQVANSAQGLRGPLLTSPARWRAMTALLLLGPWTPMLFQGEEFGSCSPFVYFADFADQQLAAAVRQGRGEFLTQFPSIGDGRSSHHLDDPGAVASFEKSKLEDRKRFAGSPVLALHRDLLRIRREDSAIARQERGAVDGSVLSPSAFLLRFFTAGFVDDRVLIVNLGADFMNRSIADPLLAPPEGTDWSLRWSSDDPRYGGQGVPDVWPDCYWRIPGECALLIQPGPKRPIPYGPRRRTA